MKIMVRFNELEERDRFIALMKEKNVTTTAFPTLMTIIVVYSSIAEFLPLTEGYNVRVFEDFTMSPFYMLERDILYDEKFMVRLAAAYRSGSMAEDYRQQYSDMAYLIQSFAEEKRHPVKIENFKSYAEEFHKRHLHIFVRLDEILAQRN